MPKSVKLLLLSLSVVLVLAVFLGVNARGVSAAGSDVQQGAYKQIDVYGEVLQHIQTDYVEDPNMGTVTNGALRGLLESLDADSSYLSPADYKTYKAGKGGKAQVGLNVSKRFGYAVVVSVVPGSPAEKADLVDGDLIEAIGTQDTRDLSLVTIQQLLEGTPGSVLTLAVVRPAKATPDKVSMTRTVVSQAPVLDTLYENGSILELRPAILDREHVNAMEAKLKSAQKGGSEKKVVLDLRDVSAGDMDEGVRLANLFLKSGTIATLSGQKFPKQTFSAEASETVDPTTPIVVLVNRGTAGAAEVAAAALEDNKRGQVVGEKTFGEGAQQKTFELPDGGAVILTIAKYATPDGKPLEGEGVTPDVQVAASTEDRGGDAETSGVEGHPEALPKHSGVQQPDEQLNKALEILKGKAA